MKKFLTFLLTLIISLSTVMFVACEDPEEAPQYSTEWTYNDTHHWRAEITGDGYIAKAEHVNKYGRCECGKYFECPELVFEPARDSEGNIRENADGSPVNKELFCVGDNDPEWSLTYKHILIPTQAEWNGKMYPVKAIGYRAFEKEPIETIVLQEGLVTISNEAFARTTALKEVVVPNSVKNYGTSMMYQAAGLERFVFGTGATSVPGYMFYSCAKLKEVVMPNTITKLGVVCFTDNRELEYVVVPSSVTSIPGHKDNDRAVGVDNDFGPSFNNSGMKVFLEHDAATVAALVAASLEQEAAIKEYVEKLKEDPNYVYTKITLLYFRTGWDATGEFFTSEEWHYDENGKPVPNN